MVRGQVRRWDKETLLYVSAETCDMWAELKDERGQAPKCSVCGCRSVAVPGKRLALVRKMAGGIGRRQASTRRMRCRDRLLLRNMAARAVGES